MSGKPTRRNHVERYVQKNLASDPVDSELHISQVELERRPHLLQVRKSPPPARFENPLGQASDCLSSVRVPETQLIILKLRALENVDELVLRVPLALGLGLHRAGCPRRRPR